jgi:hypothetical protein
LISFASFVRDLSFRSRVFGKERFTEEEIQQVLAAAGIAKDMEVEYRQRLRDGLRHAALKGVRPDKRPGLVRRSVPMDGGPF